MFNFKNKQGFTILELLITTLIFAIFIIAATAMFFYIQRGHEKVLIIQKLSSNHYFAIETMKHALRNAQNINITPEGNKITFTNQFPQQIYLSPIENSIYFNINTTAVGQSFNLTSSEIKVNSLIFSKKGTPPLIGITLEMQTKTKDGIIVDQKTRTNISVR